LILGNSHNKQSEREREKKPSGGADLRVTFSALERAFQGPLAFSSRAANSVLAALTGAAAAVAYERAWRTRARAANMARAEKKMAAKREVSSKKKLWAQNLF
jgi:hypothetical protein